MSALSIFSKVAKRTTRQYVLVAAAQHRLNSGEGQRVYRLMLKRQREGATMSDPVRLEAGIQMLVEACPDEPMDRWDLLRTVWDEAFQSIDQRLKEQGPLEPERFNLQEANARLSELAQGRRWRS